MARFFVLILGILGLLCQVGCKQSDDSKYDDYTLLRLYPTNDEQLNAVRDFQDAEVEILKPSHGYNDSTDILTPPHRLELVKHFAEKNGLRLETKQENYGKTFERLERVPRRRVLRSFNIYGYNSNAAMQEYLDTVARRHPDLVNLEVLGNSYQGRKMRLVKISADPTAGNPIIFVDAGIHAREWVAPAMATYLIHRLTTGPEAREELRGVDWYILPLVNPDGYEYTRSGPAHRLWRKTRSKSGLNQCYGVDGNRNYGYKWGVSGVSNNPCDQETYAGPNPFSEPETQMVRNVMMENAKRMKLYVSLHSYGNYLVYPWGYTGDFLPKEWKKLDNMARKVSDAVQRAGGEPLKVLSAGRWYAAAGGSDDFAYGGVGVPYSYTMELTDGYEFQLPEYLLRKILPQFYEGFRTFGNEISKEFGNVRLKRDVNVEKCLLVS